MIRSRKQQKQLTCSWLEIIGENDIIILFGELTVVIVFIGVKIWILIGRLASETLGRRDRVGRVFRVWRVGPGLLAVVQVIRIGSGIRREGPLVRGIGVGGMGWVPAGMGWDPVPRRRKVAVRSIEPRMRIRMHWVPGKRGIGMPGWDHSRSRRVRWERDFPIHFRFEISRRPRGRPSRFFFVPHGNKIHLISVMNFFHMQILLFLIFKKCVEFWQVRIVPIFFSL